MQEISNVMKIFGIGGAKSAPSAGEAETEAVDPLKVTKKASEILPPQVCVSAWSCACLCARTRACVMFRVPTV